MESLQQYALPALALALLFIMFVLLSLMHHIRQQRRQLHALYLDTEQYALGLVQELEKHRVEITEAIMKGQALSQESVHRSINELQETLGQRQAILQRQILLDSSGVREALVERFEQLQIAITRELSQGQLDQQKELAHLREQIEKALAEHRSDFMQRQNESQKAQQQSLVDGLELLSRHIQSSLSTSTSTLNERVERLTQTTEEKLREISGQVEQRLADGFNKTTEVFSRVLEHLSRIDEAQKRITELSTSVVSLQEVLTDKRSRGAFGEVQLEALIHNVMPEGSYSLQHTLSNGTRVDCLLMLPEPTGNIAIDAKFPLESYQRMMDDEATETARIQAQRQFRRDIKKHIQDIASKYLIPGETSDGAVMFLPAESLFAEIHAHFPELVEEAHRQRVWMVSPTTLMAVLTTARAVIRDVATRKQVHIIQEHLRYLSADFGRFQQRMNKLADHIRMAHEDVKQVNTSAQKISKRFVKIERVELDDLDDEEWLGLDSSSPHLPQPPS